jgi:hypothetical protein
VRRNLGGTAKRTRYIRWPVATDEKAKARVRELRIQGGVSRYVEILVLDDWEQSRGKEAR